MSKLRALTRNTKARKKSRRIGRGNGSGAGSFAGRGMNGQNCRAGGGTRPGFEGGQTPLYRKMPKLKGFKNINRINYQVVNLDKLNRFEDNEVIDITKLYEAKLISHKDRPVKILGNGEITKAITVTVDNVSLSAKEKIEKAKGKITVLMRKEQPTEQTAE